MAFNLYPWMQLPDSIWKFPPHQASNFTKIWLSTILVILLYSYVNVEYQIHFFCSPTIYINVPYVVSRINVHTQPKRHMYSNIQFLVEKKTHDKNNRWVQYRYRSPASPTVFISAHIFMGFCIMVSDKADTGMHWC